MWTGRSERSRGTAAPKMCRIPRASIGRSDNRSVPDVQGLPVSPTQSRRESHSCLSEHVQWREVLRCPFGKRLIASGLGLGGRGSNPDNVVQRLGEPATLCAAAIFCENRAQNARLRALRAAGVPQIVTRLKTLRGLCQLLRVSCPGREFRGSRFNPDQRSGTRYRFRCATCSK